MPGLWIFLTCSLYCLFPCYIGGLAMITVGIAKNEGFTVVWAIMLGLAGNMLAIYGISRILYLKILPMGVIGFMDASIFPIIAMVTGYFILQEQFSPARCTCFGAIFIALVVTNMFVD